MSELQFDEKVITALGLKDMSPAEQDSLFEQVGSLLIDAALGRLLLSLEDVEVEKLQEYMESIDETVDVLAYLTETYPAFESFLLEEAAALQDEVKQVLGR